MVAVQRECDQCSTTYMARHPASKYCSGRCRKRAQRARERGDLPEPQQPAAPDDLPELVVVVRAELEEAARLNTVAGQSAMVLAWRIGGPSPDTGSSVAALVRQLHETMAVALADVDGGAADPLDEIRRAREAKESRAAR